MRLSRQDIKDSVKYYLELYFSVLGDPTIEFILECAIVFYTYLAYRHSVK